MADNIFDDILQRKFCIHCYGFELLKLAFREIVTYQVSGEGFRPIVNKDKCLPQIYYFEEVSYFPLCAKHKDELQIDTATKHRFDRWFVSSMPETSRGLLRSIAKVLNNTKYPYCTGSQRIKSIVENEHDVLFLGGILGKFWSSFAFLDLSSDNEDVILFVAKKNVLFNLKTLCAAKIAESLRHGRDLDLLISRGEIPAACCSEIRKCL